MTSSRLVRPGTPPEAIVLAAMALVAGAGCLAAAAFSGAAAAPRGLTLAIGSTCVVITVALAQSGRRVPAVVLHAVVVLLMLMYGAMVAEAATERGLLLSAMGFSWLAVYVGFFLRPPAAYGYAAAIVVVLGCALLVARAPTDPSVWLTLSTAVWMAVLILTRLSARLRTEAHHDDLTGLLNRPGFSNAASQRLAIAERQAAPVAIIVIDLDGFKLVNDRHGHAAGDRLLVAVTAAWSTVLRPGDLLARFGGDEFVLLVPGLAEETIDGLLGRLALVHPVAWTAGATMCRSGESLDEAIDRADARLYRGKDARRDADDRRRVAAAVEA